MNISVIDAIMGSGKSSSAINYINDNDGKYIYISPYLDEAERIKNGCPKKNFIEPSDQIPKFAFSKRKHAEHLLLTGANIASTHQLFKMYTPDMIKSIKEQHYTLIIDEDVETFVESNLNEGDVDLLVKSGYLTKKDNTYILSDPSYSGEKFSEEFSILRSRCLDEADDIQTGDDSFFYWVLNKELLSSFDNVIIMTYLFEAQDLYYYLTINHIPYTKIGIERKNNQYYFSNDHYYVPEYVKTIKSKVTVIDNPKLNSVGDADNALSDNWYKRMGNNGTKQLKNNLYNYFYNLSKDVDTNCKMWCVYKQHKPKLKGKGYTSGYTVFNLKATNEYRYKTTLAYCVNIYLKPEKKRYFLAKGCNVNEDLYSLSTMVQWVWRSAIRDGNNITIYIPSKRMRSLFVDWMDSL